VFNKKCRENIFGGNNLPQEDFNFDLIDYYFRNKDHADAFQVLNDRFINDIDFHEVFAYIDRTHSKIGQQYFFNKLLTIDKNTSFEKQETLIDIFLEKEAIKTKVQTLLAKFNKREAYYISNLFIDEYIAKPKWFWVVNILSVLGIVALGFVFVVNKVFILLLFLFVINVMIHLWNKRNIMVYMDSIPQLYLLCNTASKLLNLNIDNQYNNSVAHSIRSLNELKKKLFLFKFERKVTSDIEALVLSFWEIIKILFLIEPLVIFDVLKKLDKKRKDIQILFEYIGEFDSAISIARLRMEIPYCCKPTISDSGNVFEFTNIYHPLIPDCVANSLKLTNKSILLIGSNMSGKTTFIRTVGINLLLAQTINTCFAKDFRLSQTRLFSAIRISDDLLNDKSYYFEEVLTIKNMVDESHALFHNIFLLDEIFKGTNTIERIAAGKAVLSYLTKSTNNIVFVSTHDIELFDFLSEEYDLYHFTEIIKAEQIYFDYKIKQGNLSTKNAIRILEMNGYPKTVIGEARRISQILQNKHTKNGGF
jgi:DNA mismatch repair ATPase MutS